MQRRKPETRNDHVAITVVRNRDIGHVDLIIEALQATGRIEIEDLLRAMDWHPRRKCHMQAPPQVPVLAMRFHLSHRTFGIREKER